MKMSTTLPYLSKYGNRSSAVVPKIHTQTRSYTKPFNFIPTKILERERERERGAYGRWCWERGESRCRWCPEGLFFRSATLLQREGDEWGVDWIRLGLGFVCCGEIGDEDRTFLKDLEFGGLFFLELVVLVLNLSIDIEVTFDWRQKSAFVFFLKGKFFFFNLTYFYYYSFYYCYYL